MSKIKELLNDGSSSLDNIRFDAEFQEWENSEQYVDFVNNEFMEAKPEFSISDINSAIDYGYDSIIVSREEVGGDVFKKLLREKVAEYLWRNA